MFNKF